MHLCIAPFFSGDRCLSIYTCGSIFNLCLTKFLVVHLHVAHSQYAQLYAHYSALFFWLFARALSSLSPKEQIQNNERATAATAATTATTAFIKQ
jgi:hypothetical protein